MPHWFRHEIQLLLRCISKIGSWYHWIQPKAVSSALYSPFYPHKVGYVTRGHGGREFESRREQGKAVFKILEEYIILKCIHFTTKTDCNRMNLGNQQKPIKNNYNRKTNEQNQLKSTKNQQTSAKHRKNREKCKATDIDRTNIPTLFMNQ